MHMASGQGCVHPGEVGSAGTARACRYLLLPPRSRQPSPSPPPHAPAPTFLNSCGRVAPLSLSRQADRRRQAATSIPADGLTTHRRSTLCLPIYHHQPRTPPSSPTRHPPLPLFVRLVLSVTFSTNGPTALLAVRVHAAARAALRRRKAAPPVSRAHVVGEFAGCRSGESPRRRGCSRRRGRAGRQSHACGGDGFGGNCGGGGSGDCRSAHRSNFRRSERRAHGSSRCDNCDDECNDRRNSHGERPPTRLVHHG